MAVREPVWILIPVHDRKPLTLAALERLETNGDLDRYHVAVVDDGCTDGTGDAISRRFPAIEILRGDGNLWWTGAMALAMEHAAGRGATELVWLNDDVRVPPGALPAMVEFVRAHPGSIVGAQGDDGRDLGDPAFGGKRKTWRGFRYLRAPAGAIWPCDLLSGNVVCMPRSVIDAVGLPDVRLVPHYGGDSLFLVRASNRGFRLHVDARFEFAGVPGESPLFPSRWLDAPGHPLRLARLAFDRRSGLSWRLWLALDREAYGVWGLVMFAKKYVEILAVTALRVAQAGVREASRR